MITFTGLAPVRWKVRMDRDANYVAVGAFVLLVLGMGATFLFWYTDQGDRHTYDRYEIYFKGSVSGLSAGSPVRFLGVDVGKVVRIGIDPQQRHRVEVVADIDSSAPIDSSTRASLSMQGITGLLFIDLEQDSTVKAGAPLTQGLKYPVIGSGQSNIDLLLASLPELTAHMTELVQRFNRVLNDDNVHNIQLTLENARLASERVPATLSDLQGVLADARRATQEIHGTVADLHGAVTHVAPDIESAAASIRRATGTLDAASLRLDTFIAGNEPNLSRFTQQSLPQFEQLLRESRQAARDFRDLSRSLKQNPSQLIYESAYRGVQVPP